MEQSSPAEGDILLNDLKFTWGPKVVYFPQFL